MVRSDRSCSNDIVPASGDCAKKDDTASHDVPREQFEAVFEELERWNDVLHDHRNTIMRGPRP